MERVKTLLNKINEQFEQQKTASELLYIAEMLVAELKTATHKQGIETQGNVFMQMPYGHTRTEQEVTTPTPPVITEVVKPNINIEQLSEQFFKQTTLTVDESQKTVLELNETLVSEAESVHDILKSYEAPKEVLHTIKEAPVKDLRKAISLNDKYLFVQELFAGDETLYDRCIKTINNFSVFPEAETWIKRELLIKMSWKEDSPTVQHFHQLVNRRFSVM